MLIHDKHLGRMQLWSIPLPKKVIDFYGTYTFSGKVLVSYKTKEDKHKKDWYNVAVVNDDGSEWYEIFSGEITQKQGANGIRWMVFPDNTRILLGDYIMECLPSIDNCKNASIAEIRYPEVLLNNPGIFMHWSEIIIAPDNEHIAWTALTMTGAINYLGKLKKEETLKDGIFYSIENACVISSTDMFEEDKDNKGFYKALPVRGGEVKQFIKGGRALSLVGNGDSVTESVVQMLDSDKVMQITDTPGYEETVIFSPDEKLGVAMSPRFSEKTNCSIFGLIPQPNSMLVRGKFINILYMYSVAGVRAFRDGHVGPVLLDIDRSVKEGRGYRGVDLSDPEREWIYHSPISWHPSSTRAMWNERTRLMRGEQQCRLRVVKLLDYTALDAVKADKVPSCQDIPYSLPVGLPMQQNLESILPIRIKGKVSGEAVSKKDDKAEGKYVVEYINYSDDNKTFYNGWMSIIAPVTLFGHGSTIFDSDLKVEGEHEGQMKLRVEFNRESTHAPAMLNFEKDDNGLAKSRGYASYDGIVLRIEDMEP